MSVHLSSPAGRLMLAPMEGVLDPLMRRLLTAINPYDVCVTEFIRIVQQRLSARAFYRLCPELKQQGRTDSGTPVRVQLLGQHPQWLAENAVLATELGSSGIDINFGCPAKRVNQSCGGAALLKTPELMYDIIRTVRAALPVGQILSAKVRLGWSDPAESSAIVAAVVEGGVDELTIHARTKEDGYQAQAIKWPAIAPFRQKLTIPVIANGEIWNAADAENCRVITGCSDLMLGRGALQLPNLGAVIAGIAAPMSWLAVLSLMEQYAEFALDEEDSIYLASRMKQWLSYLQYQYPEAKLFFREVRTLHAPLDMIQAIQRTRDIVAAESQPVCV